MRRARSGTETNGIVVGVVKDVVRDQPLLPRKLRPRVAGWCHESSPTALSIVGPPFTGAPSFAERRARVDFVVLSFLPDVIMEETIVSKRSRPDRPGRSTTTARRDHSEEGGCKHENTGISDDRRSPGERQTSSRRPSRPGLLDGQVVTLGRRPDRERVGERRATRRLLSQGQPATDAGGPVPDQLSAAGLLHRLGQRRWLSGADRSPTFGSAPRKQHRSPSS